MALLRAIIGKASAGRLGGILGLAALAFAAALPTVAGAQPAHNGVASCAGSTCHGRGAGDGAVVRQNELVVWQDYTSAAGAHSKAWRTLQGPWAQKIADRLGLGHAASEPSCLGCHADPAPRRGPNFQVSDGVGCESCHGGSERWLASHYAAGASRADNLSRGMKALDDPQVLASTCLDCHFGSDKPGQFVSHRMMAAGHPRLSFELDLFNSFQRHHTVDADYLARKRSPGGVTSWAVGQAMALDRSLTLFALPRGQDGVFPEFYFFDCHSCHRAISDDPNPAVRFGTNPARPIAWGAPPYNDENMILLTAAARVAAPELAERFAADSAAFHQAMGGDRASAIAAARRLSATTRQLSARFASRGFSPADTKAILRLVLGDALSVRYTDYSGGVQAVMAVDTLLTALVNQGAVSAGTASGMRRDIEAAYAAVRDPNSYRPTEFRAALGRVRTTLERVI
ncbi:MAG TPA: multiheme c-type cytochrome [Caulobacter sp.]|nr:multiheme c-type cytochrome [Caulobacter sp.]